MMMYWYGVDLKWAYSEVLSNICRQTACKQRALDVLHDSLVRFALAKNPDRNQYPHAFLQTIVRNQIIDAYHERNRYVPFSSDDDQADAYSKYKLVPSAEHLVDIQQRLATMQSMIDNLPPRCREAFWLFRIEGKNQSEIAEQLGVSRNMVQRHIMRAMIELLEAQDLIL